MVDSNGMIMCNEVLTCITKSVDVDLQGQGCFRFSEFFKWISLQVRSVAVGCHNQLSKAGVKQ